MMPSLAVEKAAKYVPEFLHKFLATDKQAVAATAA